MVESDFLSGSLAFFFSMLVSSSIGFFIVSLDNKQLQQLWAFLAPIVQYRSGGETLFPASMVCISGKIYHIMYLPLNQLLGQEDRVLGMVTWVPCRPQGDGREAP